MSHNLNGWRHRLSRLLLATACLAALFALAPANPAAAHAGAAPFPAASPGNHFGYWWHSSCTATANTWLHNNGNGHTPSNTTIRAGYNFNRTGVGQSSPSWVNWPAGGTYQESNSEIRFESQASWVRLSTPGLYTRGQENYPGQTYYRIMDSTYVQSSSNRQYYLRDQYWRATGSDGRQHVWFTYNNGALQISGGDYDPARAYKAAGYPMPWVQDIDAPKLYREGREAIEIRPTSALHTTTPAPDDRFTRTVNSSGARRTFTNHRYWMVESAGKDMKCWKGSGTSGSHSANDRENLGNSTYCDVGPTIGVITPDFTSCNTQRNARLAGTNNPRALSAAEADWWLNTTVNTSRPVTDWDGQWTMRGTRPSMWQRASDHTFAFNQLTDGSSYTGWNGQGVDGQEITTNGPYCPGIRCPGANGYLGWENSPAAPSWAKFIQGTHRFRNWLDIRWNNAPSMRRFMATFRDATWFDNNGQFNSGEAYNGPALHWDNHAPELKDLPGMPPGTRIIAEDLFDGTPDSVGRFRFTAQAVDANMPLDGSGIFRAYLYYRPWGDPNGAWNFGNVMDATLTGSVYTDTRNLQSEFTFPDMGGLQEWEVTIRVEDNVGNLSEFGRPGDAVVIIPDHPVPPLARPDSAGVAVGGSVSIDVLANDENHNEAKPSICPEWAWAGWCDIDPASVQIDQQPAEGTVEVVRVGPGARDVRVRYTPHPWASNRDYFTYSFGLASGGRSAPAGVMITITDGNPNAAEDSATTDNLAIADGRAFIDVLANDTDPDDDIDPGTLRVVSTTNGVTATVAVDPADGRHKVQITGMPNGDVRSARLTYLICDSRGSAWFAAGIPPGYVSGAPWPSAANAPENFCDTAEVNLVFRVLAPT